MVASGLVPDARFQQPSPFLSSNRKVGNSAGRKDSDWRIANSEFFWSRKISLLEGTAPAVPKKSRSCRNETGGQCSCIAEFVQNFSRSGTKLEGCSPEQPSVPKFSVVQEHDPPVKTKTTTNGE